MTPMWTPPGHATDLDAIPHGRAAWDVTVAQFFSDAADRVELAFPDDSRSQFVDAVHDGATLAWTPAPIGWNGFPKSLLVDHPVPADALVAADELVTVTRRDGSTFRMRPQDEYLEWHTTRDADGRILAVDFTCEGPEYWQAIAHGYPDVASPPDDAPEAHGDLAVVTALYREFVDPTVEQEDLLDAEGRYDPWNRWNTELGAMHLTHVLNTLQFEVFLAADASVLREQNGHPLTDDDKILECAQYGSAARSSDPVIGGAVNRLARSGALVSLLDPVGVYIGSLNTDGWTKPGGAPVDDDYWTIRRGTADCVLRARYEVPATEDFVVSDLRIGGERIRHAGQIARKIRMKLTGVSAEAGRHAVAAVGCTGGPVDAVVADPGGGGGAAVPGRARTAS